VIRILVVEDSQEKLRRVLGCLSDVPGCGGDAIDNARDSVEARRLLRANTYDLLILDIALPDRADALPSPDGGIRLLAEILDRDIYRQPREVVGLTAFADIRETAGPMFAEELWTVIQYDPTTLAWEDQLRRKVRHILLAERAAGGVPEFGAHLCVVTALTTPELSAVLALPWQWSRLDLPADGTIYYRGILTKDGIQKEVIAAAAARMGMTAAAVLTMKMIDAFHPRYVSMCGIAAGFPDKCSLGDVIAVDPTWDYGSGKWKMERRIPVFLPSPHQIGLDSFIRGKLSLMAQDGGVLDEIRRKWTVAPVSTALRLHIGPVASGAAVIAEPKAPSIVKGQHRGAFGLEMETYGVYAACQECRLPQPKAFALKSVCDFANAKKSDDHQAYAAFTSAVAMQLFVERFL